MCRNDACTANQACLRACLYELCVPKASLGGKYANLDHPVNPFQSLSFILCLGLYAELYH
jgi:hypothetical protein